MTATTALSAPSAPARRAAGRSPAPA
ncbi:multiple sugar transport system permease protein, partial [Streptomyces sp. MnatMP-M27]